MNTWKSSPNLHNLCIISKSLFYLFVLFGDPEVHPRVTLLRVGPLGERPSGSITQSLTHPRGGSGGGSGGSPAGEGQV